MEFRRSIKRKRQAWIASLESAHQTMLELIERDRARIVRTLEDLDMQPAARQGLNESEEFACWMQCASIAYSMGRNIRDLKRIKDSSSLPTQLDSRSPKFAQGTHMEPRPVIRREPLAVPVIHIRAFAGVRPDNPDAGPAVRHAMWPWPQTPPAREGRRPAIEDEP